MRPLVGIDASRYPGEIQTGTETYTRSLLDALADRDDLPFAMRSYVNSARDEDVENLSRLGEVRRLPFPRFWTHGRLSLEMLRHRPDLLFVPAHVIPVVHPRSVVTVHDLGYLHEPEAHPGRQRRMLDLTTRWNARVASRVIAISETTKADLIRFYGTPPDKISVIHHGVDERFMPASPGDEARVRAQFNLPERFVLAVGTIQPRKNLARLASAVASLHEQFPGLALVLAGKQGWMADSVLAEVRRSLPASHLRVLGYVPRDDIAALYSAASATAMVSTYEGFGLPVLEAFRSRSPLVISDTPALVEVADDAALIAAATSATNIADQIGRLLSDPAFADEMRARGLERAADFSWARAAEKTIDTLDQVLRAHG